MDVDCGHERDRVHPAVSSSLDVRWWLYIAVEGAEGRPQRPRLGVVDNGFRFARGGRARSEAEAQDAIRAAYDEASLELEYWRGQPSHALGAGGELIPLGDLLPELPAGRVELPA